MINWRKIRKIAGYSRLLVLCCVMTMSVQAQEFMAVKDVQEGMTGYAKTVVHGTAIETFPVKIIGVMKNSGPSGDLVLAEFSGPLIERSGGIAQGMSGSPVYINGKLLGAVAYGWSFTKSRLGMITPITDMVKLWNVPNENEMRPFNAREASLIPITTPLMTSGLDSASLQWFVGKLPQYRFHPVAAPTSSGDGASVALEPGSAVAAALMNGDMKMGAIGTVTYVDGDHIVAFGHPFLKKGSINYFMHNAYIFTIVNSLNTSFKLGSIGRETGVIEQDRGAGIAGRRNDLRPGIPVIIKATDEDTGTTLEKRVKIVEDNELTPVLASTAVYNTINKTLDRFGGGTVSLTYTIRGAGGTDRDITRHNMYYSSENINEKSIDELYNVLDMLKHNEFIAYPVLDIQMNVRVSQAKKTARIVDASAAPAVVAPGDEIYLKVKLHPYRGADETRILSFTVPKDQPLGEMILEIRGGGVTPLPYLIERQKYNLTDEILARLRHYKDFAELKKKIETEESNNDLVVEILDKNVSMVPDKKDTSDKVKIREKVENPTDSDLRKPHKKGAKEEKDTEAKTLVPTPYIILGDGQLTFQVVRPQEREKYRKKYRSAAGASAVMKAAIETAEGATKKDRKDSKTKNAEEAAAVSADTDTVIGSL